MQQIADWLKTLGMSEYAERFAENDIDTSVLRSDRSGPQRAWCLAWAWVRNKRHPDPIGENVRWQIEDGEVLNALGRARAVNRGPGTPQLRVRMLFNNCLPITVDECSAGSRRPFSSMRRSKD